MSIKLSARVWWGMSGLLLGAVGGHFAGRMAGPAGEIAAKVGTGGAGNVSMVAGGGAAAASGRGGKDHKPGAGDGKGSVADAGGVLKEVRGLPPGRALRRILAEADPVRRLSAMREWSAGLEPTEMLLVMKEFKGMLEAQEQVGGEEVMGLFLQSVEVIAQGMVDRGAAGVLQALLQQGDAAEGEDREMAYGLGGQVFKKWAERDPAAARDLVEDRLAARLSGGGKIGEVEREFSKELMRAWVKTEPEAAMEWLLKMPDEIGKGALGPAFQSLSHTHPEKALRMVEAQADLPGRDEIAGTIAGWWAKSTPDKALEWARGLPEKLAGASVSRVMTSWAAKDMAEAQAALPGLPEPLRQAALPGMVEVWEGGKWNEAAGFLNAQPAGSGRVEATRVLMGRWVREDQQAASGWLAGQPAGAERDAGAVALADGVRGTDPEAAAVWGATLSDAEARRNSLKATMREWYGKSVPEALKWLENTDSITDSERAFLTGEMPPAGK